MAFYTVAIIGRPNVGKSTLFNAIVGERVSIVEPTPGVTRDRVLRRVRLEDKEWDLIDTGGIGIIDNQNLSEEIGFQLDLSINQADLVLFVVDVQSGIIPDDYRICSELRKANKHVILLANKADDEDKENLVHEFHSLGLGDPTPISAKAYRGVISLKELIAEHAPTINEEHEADIRAKEHLKIAIVGRRNVGKSTFINYIAGENRVIASQEAGTTRDSVDVFIEKGIKKFVLIDTAGMRRKTKLESAVEFFATCRTERSIMRADVIVLFLDAVEGISGVDGKLAKLIKDEGKPVIIATTKIDLAEGVNRQRYLKYLDKHMPGLSYAPLIFVSGHTGENVWKLIDLAYDLYERATMDVPTSKLNQILDDAQRRHPHPVVFGKRPRFFYATQIKNSPPRFLIFVRHKKQIKENYTRFLANEFRRALHAEEVPFTFTLRENERIDYAEDENGKIH